MIATSHPAAAVPAVTRPPGRLRAARALALAIGALTTLGAVVIGVGESDSVAEWALSALILGLAAAWIPVALRLAPGRPVAARAALVLAALGTAHGIVDVVVFGWWSSAVLAAVTLTSGALVAPFARR